MSYILDALRKSETERSLGAYAPAKDPAFEITDRSSSRLRSALIVAAVGAIGGLTLFWLFLDKPRSESGATVDQVLTATRPAATPRESVPTAADRSTRELAQEAVVPTVHTTPKPAKRVVTTTPVSPASGPQGANDDVKFLRLMPASFRSRLPKLEINIHVYSPDLSQQILFINNHEVKPGQRVDGGAVLEAITPDGAILRLEHTRFKLPRPS